MMSQFDNFAVDFGELFEGLAECRELFVVCGGCVSRIGGGGGFFVVVVEKLATALAAAGEVADAVHGDAEEPGLELAVFDVVACADFDGDGGEDGLGDFLSDVEIVAAGLGESEDSRAVAAHEFAPGTFIASDGARQQTCEDGRVRGRRFVRGRGGHLLRRHAPAPMHRLTHEGCLYCYAGS